LLRNLDYSTADVVNRLVSLYDHSFGGKPRGRYRISMKLMCRLLNQRRLWPEQVEEIRRGMYETGYIFIDLGSYFAVVSQRTFASYRRLNEASIVSIDGELGEKDSVDCEDGASNDIKSTTLNQNSLSD
jgi:hypothetical protein